MARTLPPRGQGWVSETPRHATLTLKRTPYIHSPTSICKVGSVTDTDFPQHDLCCYDRSCCVSTELCWWSLGQRGYATTLALSATATTTTTQCFQESSVNYLLGTSQVDPSIWINLEVTVERRVDSFGVGLKKN